MKIDSYCTLCIWLSEVLDSTLLSKCYQNYYSFQLNICQEIQKIKHLLKQKTFCFHLITGILCSFGKEILIKENKNLHWLIFISVMRTSCLFSYGKKKTQTLSRHSKSSLRTAAFALITSQLLWKSIKSNPVRVTPVHNGTPKNLCQAQHWTSK